MKIKQTVNVIKEIDVEIKTPYFCKSKNECVFYKVLNEKGHTIRVSTYSFAVTIEFSEMLNEGLVFDQDNTEIGESEFNAAFENAVEILVNK